MFAHVAIIGFGLIGSSIARALRAHAPETRIIAIDADPRACAQIMFENLADEAHAEIVDRIMLADLVIYAVPLEHLADVAAKASMFLKSGAIVTDVSSVKHAAAQIMAEHLPEDVHLVPGHPIAGSEERGVGAGSADLFTGKRVILTPENPQSPGVAEVAAFWAQLGAKVEYMPADPHDRIYAAVSHLPQYLAFFVEGLYLGREAAPQNEALFARFMRLTRSDPVLWAPVFSVNKNNINSFLQWFLEVVHQLRSELSEHTEKPDAPANEAVVYGTLLPYMIASGLVSVAFRLEKELGVPVARFAGSGFRDFTAPLEAPPEPVLELVSAHATEVVAALDHFVSLLTTDSVQ